jgi:hypothetical protein
MPTKEPNDPAEEEARLDWTLLDLLTDPNNHRPWSLGELEREVGSAVDAADSVRRLYLDGLAHRTSDGFVFATRAAIRYHQLIP